MCGHCLCLEEVHHCSRVSKCFADTCQHHGHACYVPPFILCGPGGPPACQVCLSLVLVHSANQHHYVAPDGALCTCGAGAGNEPRCASTGYIYNHYEAVD